MFKVKIYQGQHFGWETVAMVPSMCSAMMIANHYRAKHLMTVIV